MRVKGNLCALDFLCVGASKSIRAAKKYGAVNLFRRFPLIYGALRGSKEICAFEALILCEAALQCGGRISGGDQKRSARRSRGDILWSAKKAVRKKSFTQSFLAKVSKETQEAQRFPLRGGPFIALGEAALTEGARCTRFFWSQAQSGFFLQPLAPKKTGGRKDLRAR